MITKVKIVLARLWTTTVTEDSFPNDFDANLKEYWESINREDFWAISSAIAYDKDDNVLGLYIK